MSNKMELAEVFGDHMILQREQSIRIFGTGHGVAQAELNGQTVQATSTGDHWMLEFPATAAGGPYTLRIVLNDYEKILRDIYIGDVWLAGG